jgi:NitT/TauT family transport system substrate-binding protein
VPSQPTVIKCFQMGHKSSLKKTAGLLTAMVLTATCLSSCSPNDYNGPVETIRIAVLPGQTAAQVYVAQDRGFFARNGIEIVTIDYDTGILAAEGMARGEADTAICAEIALVQKAFDKKPVSAIAVADKIESFYLVANRSKGIENITGLKGKRIGVSLPTIGAFYLDRFLTLNGISSGSVTLVDVVFPQSAGALESGAVDAVVVIEPYVSDSKKALGSNAISWDVQSGQPLFGMFIASNAWIKEHPDLVKRFLKAIEEANGFIAEQPGEAKKYLKTRFDYSDEYLESVWLENRFELFLDQPFIIAMEDEARWMISSGRTTETRIPNFLEYIHEGGLKAIKPDAVRIIR